MSLYLSSIGADPVQSSGGAVQEADDLQEVFIPDTPGAVDQEHQVCFGCLADLRRRQGKANVRKYDVRKSG